MPLVRGHHSFDGQYAQIPNAWLRDDRLGLDTRGLLAQLMSHSPGWRISQENLARANKVGRDSIRRMIRELVEYGYLEVSEKQNHNEQGHLTGFTYTTRDPLQVEPLLAEPTKADTAHKKTIKQEPNIKEQNIKNSSKRKTQLGVDWKPDERVLAMQPEKWPLLDVKVELDAFHLYYRAKGSTFIDWNLVFQKWMNQAQKWAAEKQPKEHYTITKGYQ